MEELDKVNYLLKASTNKELIKKLESRIDIDTKIQRNIIKFCEGIQGNKDKNSKLPKNLESIYQQLKRYDLNIYNGTY